jgi:16S rRNA processing protein RimM
LSAATPSVYVTRPLAVALKAGTVLHVGEAERVIERRAGTDLQPIIRLAGVASRDAAQQLRGTQLSIRRELLPPLGEGEWWAHELEGLRVTDGERQIGSVKRMIVLPTCEALQVAGDAGGELIIPLVRDAVRRVDVAAGTIDVDARFIGED